MFVVSVASLLRKTALCCLTIACVVFGQAPGAVAQMDMTSHTMETKDETPPNQLPVPQKLAGVCDPHIYESARAFEQSVRVDPRWVTSKTEPSQKTSVYRRAGDRAVPERRSARPSASQSFVLRCMLE